MGQRKPFLLLAALVALGLTSPACADPQPMVIPPPVRPSIPSPLAIPMPQFQPVIIPSAPIAGASTPVLAPIASPRKLPARIAPPPGKDYASRRPLKDIRAPTMAAINSMLAPVAADAVPDPEAARALDILKRNKLDQGAVSTVAPSGLAEKVGQAMMMGGRSAEFLPELAAVCNALPRGNKAARDPALTLWKKMGRMTPPKDKDLNGMLNAAKDACTGSVPPPQHGSIADSGGNDIQVDTSPSGGTSRVNVIIPDGPGSAPERVTFGGHQTTVVDGGDLKTVVAPEPARVMTTQDAESLRTTVNGAWTDQDGESWDISGGGNDIVFVSTSASDHKMEYTGQWNLGAPGATHIVNDVDDIANDLPGDVRSALASDWHPPFAIRLEYRPEDDTFEGVWISGQVTYSGMSHNIKIVDDPTWDKPLLLTRDNVDTAYGASADERL